MSTPADARRVSVLIGALFGLAGLGSSSAAIALPVLADDLGVSTGVSAWAISLPDACGRRRDLLRRTARRRSRRSAAGLATVIGLPVLGALLLPLIWRALPTEGSGARLDLLGAALVAGTSAGLVMVVQSPSTGPVVAAVGAALLVLGAPTVGWWVRRRPHGFLLRSVLDNDVVVRSSVASAAVPATWFALLIAVPAVLVGAGWEAWQVGVALLPSAVTGLAAPRIAAPLLTRIGSASGLRLAGAIAALALVVAALGAATVSAVPLVAAVVAVTFAFGLGQPALMSAVGDAVVPEVRGVALGLATLMFLVGGGVGSAVIGGLGGLLGMAGSLLVLAAFPVLGLLALPPSRQVERSGQA